jgi:hypothetical protein
MFGRFRFARLPFGLVISKDVFQKQLDSALEGLSGVTGIADDTLIYGSTEEEYDWHLAKLMERAKEKGIVFNQDKLQFKCQEVSFFDHTWSPQGVRPDNRHSVCNTRHSDDVKNLQNFLGLANNLTRYSCRLATIKSPLREQTLNVTVHSTRSSKKSQALDRSTSKIFSLKCRNNRRSN